MESSKQRRARYLKKKLKGLSEQERAEALKGLIEAKTLEQWREWGIRAWAKAIKDKREE